MRENSRIIALVTICAFALVLSFATVSSAEPRIQRIAVVEHATTDTVVDLTANGDSTGDLLTFHNELFDATNTDVVGSSHGDCVRIEAGVSWECRWINALEDGSITVEGAFFDDSPSAFAITGGTGAFRGARGSMRLVARDDSGTEFDFIFRVLVD